MRMQTETELEQSIRQVTEGNLRAFEDIYRNTSGFVYGVALRYAPTDADAKDIAQQVFLKVHASIARFRPETSFKAWIYRITVNTALNFLQKRKRDRAREQVFSESSVPAAAAPAVAARIRDEDACARLARLLELLTPEQRECMLLREIDGMSYREIADALDENINTVRARLRRGRMTLMEHINGKGGCHGMS